MTDKAGYHQAAFGGDTIRTVTLTPQEQAAYASGWNRAIEASAKKCRDDAGRFDTPDRIRALSMPAPAPAQAWRDIGTAPKDGTCVILWLKGHYGKDHMMWPCMFIHGDWCWEISDNSRLDYDYEILEGCEITHWMPLPAPPAALTPDTEGGA